MLGRTHRVKPLIWHLTDFIRNLERAEHFKVIEVLSATEEGTIPVGCIVASPPVGSV